MSCREVQHCGLPCRESRLADQSGSTTQTGWAAAWTLPSTQVWVLSLSQLTCAQLCDDTQQATQHSPCLPALTHLWAAAGLR